MVEEVERRRGGVAGAKFADDPFGMDVDPHFGRDPRGELVEIQPGKLPAVRRVKGARFHHRIAEHHRDAKRRSEAHTSELQSLMRITYAVFCLKKKIPITD